ncbi:Fic family protein [Acidobacteriota bacterium]
MKNKPKNRYSGPVTVFHEIPLPERATPCGYAALIDAYDLKVPLPRTLFGTGERHRIVHEAGWQILTPRHSPRATLEGHLTFALKNEGIDLAVLNRLFRVVPGNKIEILVRAKPTGSYTRRIWFLYEWLTGSQLKIPNADKCNYVQVVDPSRQWDIEGENSPRYRVKNNLPGTSAFCPMVFRTDRLAEFNKLDLAQRARAIISDMPRDLLARTAAFLLLKDLRSTYAIEGVRAPQSRIQRWGRAIGEAGRHTLDVDELLRLQRIVIGDARFVRLGLREEGGFVGDHDRENRMPLPIHISARPDDLRALLEGMIAFDQGPAQRLDAVIAAAMLAFGFVYVHPFVDGNGRIHRYLIHHVLAQRGFNPPGALLPVSAALLERIDEYRVVLEDYSRRLLPVIDWEPTKDGNVRVLNDTADYYRFFDATPHAEFLFSCMRETIERDLPNEADFLRRYDRFRTRVDALIDMPDRTVDLLFRFLHQSDGKLSMRARTREFAELTDREAAEIEDIYDEIFAE